MTLSHSLKTTMCVCVCMCQLYHNSEPIPIQVRDTKFISGWLLPFTEVHYISEGDPSYLDVVIMVIENHNTQYLDFLTIYKNLPSHSNTILPALVQ